MATHGLKKRKEKKKKSIYSNNGIEKLKDVLSKVEQEENIVPILFEKAKLAFVRKTKMLAVRWIGKLRNKIVALIEVNTGDLSKGKLQIRFTPKFTDTQKAFKIKRLDPLEKGLPLFGNNSKRLINDFVKILNRNLENTDSDIDKVISKVKEQNEFSGVDRLKEVIKRFKLVTTPQRLKKKDKEEKEDDDDEEDDDNKTRTVPRVGGGAY